MRRDGAWVGPHQLVFALAFMGLAGGVMAFGWALSRGFLKETLYGHGRSDFRVREAWAASPRDTGYRESGRAKNALCAGDRDGGDSFVFCTGVRGEAE